MRRIVVLSALLGLGVSTAAPAEPPIGSRLGERLRASAEKIDEGKAARYAHSMAKCVVNKRRTGAVRLLASPDPKALASAHKALWGGELTCYSGFEAEVEYVEARRFSMPLDIERGLVAEHMLRQLNRQAAALSPLPLRQGSYSRAWFGGTTRNAVVDEMSACVADTAPSGILAVFATEPYTPEEKAAFGALTPTMGSCLSVGAKLTGNRQSVRAALADALYQRVMNPAASVPLVAEIKK